jgi:hypothetical protein
MMAITLMCGVLVILFIGLRLSMNAWHRGSERMESFERSFAAADALQSQVSSAVPSKLSRQENQRRTEIVCFRGSAHQARFLTRFSWAGDRSHSLWLASYQVVDAIDGQQQLIINESPMLDSDYILNALLQDDVPPAQTQPFGEAADHIEIAYWQAATPSVPGSWVSDWKAIGSEVLPRGIQIHWQRKGSEQTATFAIPIVREAK